LARKSPCFGVYSDYESDANGQYNVTVGVLNVFVMGTATTIKEGRALEASGCHAIIAQGYEAGGHRGGGFLASHPGGFIGTLALVPQMVDAVKIPVIAAGGIMDGRGIAAH
jgi:nitronate monooxygenase